MIALVQASAAAGTAPAALTAITGLAYLLAASLFIFGLKRMSSPDTARSGNRLGATGMLLAVVVTLLHHEIVSFQWIVIGLVIGSAIGAYLARTVRMTGMPQMVGMLNGFGGAASVLVAGAEFIRGPALQLDALITAALSVLVGAVTFSGSMVAAGKLHGVIRGRSITFPLQNTLNLLVFLAIVAAGVWLVVDGVSTTPLWTLIALALVLGVLLTIPVGGADMPVVISLLNSYSGLAAAMTGFVVHNIGLIISGALVGAAGIILTGIMCAAMNRSLLAVFLGTAKTTSGTVPETGARPEPAAAPEEAAPAAARRDPMEAAIEACREASSVIFIPGYGMALAQAQFEVVQLSRRLEEAGKKIRFAVHPVAGRMPGHMHVLLSEANAPWDKLHALEVNPDFPDTDLAIVIGASDVVNPAASSTEGTPISGMPILHAHEARRVIVINLDERPGYSGVPNQLYELDKAILLWGDAKQTLQRLLAALTSTPEPAAATGAN